MKICAIGGGSWGTALANLLAKKNYDVSLYVRSKKLLGILNEKRINEIYLPRVRLCPQLKFTSSVDECLSQAEIVVLAVPVQFLRETLLRIKDHVTKRHIFVNCGKGIEKQTLYLPSDIVKEILNVENFAQLSGPNFALEVAMELPTATVIASYDMNLATELQHIFFTPYFRTYTSNDVLGVQLAGALKNVVAIACGISDGLNLGENARAALITRGLVEIKRLGKRLNAKEETFMGLSGAGDLILTCTGKLSRNREVGLRLGRGEKLSHIIQNLIMVAEGIDTAKSATKLAKRYNVDMPITFAVYDILYQDKKPFQVLSELMRRPLKKE
ncbi:MAG: NAD(P)-dependent glycerol-3-phosphate dehydrogenase [Deltaproteobacteria bacterium]|nr:NAD(P)-dependent glycerol-3-phosphate dehydrogenase [Deltaproteobacteria bacterium]